jgi:hypothetical protein
LAAALALLAAAPAQARTVRIDHPPLAGPALAGAGVAWVGRDEPHGAGVWQVPFGGGAARVGRLSEDVGRRVSLSHLEASGTRLVLAKGICAS